MAAIYLPDRSAPVEPKLSPSGQLPDRARNVARPPIAKQVVLHSQSAEADQSPCSRGKHDCDRQHLMLLSRGMANKYYEPGERRSALVQDLFAAVAKRYDLVNDLQSFGMHRYWKRRLIQLARVRPGERALDLCCGTGDIAFALARQGARVVGLDFNGPMLAVAQTRFKGRAPPASPSINPQFLRSDATNIPFPENSF